jgi:hypothetical protein
MSCETCEACATADGTCDRCIESGRSEMAGRLPPMRAKPRQFTKSRRLLRAYSTSQLALDFAARL